MKKLIKTVVLVAFVIVTFAMFSISAQAATLDGFDIQYKPSKTEYEGSNQIEYDVIITNKNDVRATNITVEPQVPEGYVLKDKNMSIQTTETLDTNKSFIAKVTLKEKVIIPLFLWIIIALIAIGILSIIGIIIHTAISNNKRKAKPLMCLLLCLLLMSSIVIPTYADVSREKLDLTHTVQVDGKDFELACVMSYDTLDCNNKNLIIDTSKMLYNPDNQTYYLAEPMAALAGTLLNPDNISTAICSVVDSNGKTLLNRDFSPANMWSINDFGLVVGTNRITVSITYNDGLQNTATIVVNNLCEKNMDKLNVDKGDSDKDGILNFIEELYHTNPRNFDSDNDGVSDYYEMAIIGTDPNKKDSDLNGITDADEDSDSDGISNVDEINIHHTDPSLFDSDGDGLSDYKEIAETGTDPLVADTDSDKKSDGWEITNGYNPLVADDSFVGNEENPIPDNITIESTGNVTVIIADDNALINEGSVGYIGVAPIQVDIEEGHSAKITIEYDQSELPEGDTPALYYFNEDTQSYEKIPSNTSQSGKVTADIKKSGKYVLLNHRLIDEVLKNDIFSPSFISGGGNLDVVFVIDRSASMDSNDPNNLRKTVTKEFISKLRDGVDRAAIVQFTSIAETVAPLTTDKTQLINTVDSIQNSDGGGCAGSDSNAGTNGSAGIRAAINELEKSTAKYKYIIFMTDGSDTTVSEDYGDESGETGLTGAAKSKDIIIHTIGLVGSSGVDIDLLKRVAKGTNGNYYLATVGEEPEKSEELLEIGKDIELITLDKEKDSNADGISDYYTKLICDGKLTTGTGATRLFGGYTYDQIQENSDLDGDGLKNGDELKIVERSTGVFVQVASLPYLKNSDSDALDDPTEHSGVTSPMKKNGSVDISDVDWICNNENFMSDKYLDLYNESAFERGSVFIGNAFFGTTLNQTHLYRNMLINYFKTIDAGLTNKNVLNTYQLLAEEYISAAFDKIQEHLAELGEKQDKREYLERVDDINSFVDDIVAISDYALDGVAKNEISAAILRLTNLGDIWNVADCYYQMGIIKENMKHIPSIVTPETKADWTKYLDELNAEYIEYSTKANMLEEKLVIKSTKFSKFTSGISKCADVVGKVTMVVDLGNDVWEANLNYCDMVASMQTVSNNVYILDCILGKSDNMYLRSAASDIKQYIDTGLSEQTRNLLIALDQTENVVTGMAMDVMHEVIGTLGTPGLIIELVRDLGNIVFNIDDLSKAAAETVALAESASAISENYLDHLEAGHAVKHNKLWLAYANYSDKIYICMINLSELRKMAESKMIDYDNNKSTVEKCNSNITKCNSLTDEYSEKYFNHIAG